MQCDVTGSACSAHGCTYTVFSAELNLVSEVGFEWECCTTHSSYGHMVPWHCLSGDLSSCMYCHGTRDAAHRNLVTLGSRWYT